MVKMQYSTANVMLIHLTIYLLVDCNIKRTHHQCTYMEISLEEFLFVLFLTSFDKMLLLKFFILERSFTIYKEFYFN